MDRHALIEIALAGASTSLERSAALNELESMEYRRNTGFALATNFTPLELGKFVRGFGFSSDVKLDIAESSYDDLTSFKVASNQSAYTFIFYIFDNLSPFLEGQCTQIGFVEKCIERFLNQVSIFLASNKPKAVYLADFFAIRDPGIRTQKAIEFANEKLAAFCSDKPEIQILKTSSIYSKDAHYSRRHYFRSKNPFTTKFYLSLSKELNRTTNSFGTRYNKVLALDCDNTIWGGIIGEDGIQGIALDRFDAPGSYFFEFQSFLAQLVDLGVLICFVSKNNENDVLKVFESHPSQILNLKHAVTHRINWHDKVENLRSIAEELDLGLSSFVFVDDSDFECNNVRERLSDVDVIQVPKDPARLIDTFLEIEARFPSGSSRNLKNYRLRSQAKALEESASNLEDYIKSLDINVFVHKNNEVHSSRVSELSKKSNQFNVTTKRYEVGEILTLMRSDNIDVYCFEVSDIFGNSGITGVIIIELQDSLAKVDSFFMSCRILGRRIEFYVWEAIMSEILSQGCGEIRAEYIKTERNEMAASFFQDLGFSITGGDRKFCTSYGVCADDLPLPMPKLMEVTIGH